MKALMKAPVLVLFALSLALAPTAAQTPKPSPVAKVKAVVKAAVDTGATKATAAVVDTLLGTGGTRVGSDGCPVATTVGTALVGKVKKDLQPSPDTATRAAMPCPADPAALEAARTAQTAEQAQLDAQLQAQAAAGATPSTKTAIGAVAAATPVGLAVTAAPVAAKTLGGLFGKGQTMESMIKDLSRGRLELKGIRFVGASDALDGEVADDFSALAEALQAIEGEFVLNLPAEQSDDGRQDTVMVRRRLTKLAALLAVAGLGDRLELISGPPGLDPKRKLPKIGAARVEILRKPSPDTPTR